MSTQNYDYLRNISVGRTDWKVKVRILREWRGKTNTGEVFKKHNLLLLDSKNCRMHATVPAYLSDKWMKILTVGKMYIITNFQVKMLTPDDKWRPVNMDKQINFTNQTRAREIAENDYFIYKNTFDFFSLDELEDLSKQNILLADVVGVIIKIDSLHPVHTTKGIDQLQVKLKITDGRNKVNVTFWDEMAVDFQNQLDTQKFEKPLILIISSGKVSKWKNELDVCNFAQTAFFINYDHHSVLELRKMIQDKDFVTDASQTKKKRALEMLTVKEIQGLSTDYVEEDVACQVTIKTVQEMEQWYYSVCTSCYNQLECVQKMYICHKCNRIVPQPEKKFGICVIASDSTGEIGILLMDRPIRLIFSKRVSQFEDEFKGNFPLTLKTMENGKFTVKLQICKENIGSKDEFYLATDIYSGWEKLQTTEEEETVVRPTENSVGQASTSSSYHLENMSQLRFDKDVEN